MPSLSLSSCLCTLCSCILFVDRTAQNTCSNNNNNNDNGNNSSSSSRSKNRTCLIHVYMYVCIHCTLFTLTVHWKRVCSHILIHTFTQKTTNTHVQRKFIRKMQEKAENNSWFDVWKKQHTMMCPKASQNNNSGC